MRTAIGHITWPPRCTRALVISLALIVWFLGGNAIHASVADCEGMKIAILDLNDMAEAHNVPKCSLSSVHVRIDNGIVYTTNTTVPHTASHVFGTHSAPWYLRGAIKSSRYYTTDLDEADIIYVYDYCFYIYWLGYTHGFHEAGSTDRAGPGDALVALYTEMMKMPQWKASNGSLFAFYDPHPGFYLGSASETITDWRCRVFTNAIHLIVDTPMRNVCKHFMEMKKILVTPYVPNPLDLRNPRAYLHLPFRDLPERPTLGYCRSTCHPWGPQDGNIGKRMRYYFSYKLWGTDPAMDVRCIDQGLSSEGMLSYEEVFKKMRSSKFCPVFPGDAASTRRLSEIFLAGCIPVFLGPPYHSMPFSETVPYKELGIFFNISETSGWFLGRKPHFKLDPLIRPTHEQQAEWWVPDADVYDVMIQINHPSEVLPKLQAIPLNVLETKLRLMHEYGMRFTFLQRLTLPPSAGNSLLAGMCQKQRQYPGKPRLPGAAISVVA